MTDFGFESVPQSFDRQERLARLRLIRSENVGPITFRQLVARYGSGKKALEALPELARRGGKKRLKIYPASAATRDMEAAEKANYRMLFWGEGGYSAPLAAIEDAPPVIYAYGHSHLLENPTVAIVGARNASAVGVRFTEKLARDLGQAEWTVVSGMARGIDTAAHRGTLATGTIAVLAGGVDNIYPKENEGLYNQIAEQGLIVSEMPPGTVPQASHFPRRNRIISGLALGVVVVEATARSGSLITSRLALEQGREVFAVPGSPLDPRCQGPNNLIRQGATLISSAANVLEVMATQKPPMAYEPPDEPFRASGPSTPSVTELESARRIILEKLSHTPIMVDDLVRQCEMPAATVMISLLELEIAGVALRLPGNRVALA